MRNIERISPMTAYYLRKLLRKDEIQPIGQDSNKDNVLDVDTFFLQVSNGDRKILVSSHELEKLVTLHQALITVYSPNSPQILDIELKIYEGLGIQSKNNRKANNQIPKITPSLSPEQCIHLLKKITHLRKSCESLIGSKVTTYYLSSLIQDKQKLSNSMPTQADHISNLDSFFTRIDGNKIEQKLLNSVASKRYQKYESSGSKKKNTEMLQQQSPKRSRDLVKQFNRLQQQYTQQLSFDVICTCFLNSRPTQSWCQMFNMSETGHIFYSGDLQELITHSRFELYQKWRNAFIEQCESHLPSANTEKTAEKSRVVG